MEKACLGGTSSQCDVVLIYLLEATSDIVVFILYSYGSHGWGIDIELITLKCFSDLASTNDICYLVEKGKDFELHYVSCLE